MSKEGLLQKGQWRNVRENDTTKLGRASITITIVWYGILVLVSVQAMCRHMDCGVWSKGKPTNKSYNLRQYTKITLHDVMLGSSVYSLECVHVVFFFYFIKMFM